MAAIIFGMRMDAGRLDRRMPQVSLDEAQAGAGVRLIPSFETPESHTWHGFLEDFGGLVKMATSLSM